MALINVLPKELEAKLGGLVTEWTALAAELRVEVAAVKALREALQTLTRKDTP